MSIRYSSVLVGSIVGIILGVMVSGCKAPLETILERKPKQYTLTIEKTAGGEVKVSPAKTSYKKGEVVILSAQPDGEHRFSEWKGNINTQENPCTVTVNGQMTILAHFTAIPKYRLTAAAGTGGKIVNSAGEKTEFLEKEQCTLTAQADAGYEFVQWEGGVTGTSDKLYLTFDKNYQVYARFKKSTEYTLTATAGAGGTIVNGAGKTVFAPGEQCTLTAQADAGYEFVQWEGGASGTNDKLYLTFDKNYQVYARFKKSTEYTLTATAGAGGTIVNGAGKTVFVPGEQCTLTAQADAGYEFVQWEGDASGTNDKLYLTFDKNYQVYARFKKSTEYTLTATAGAGGTIVNGAGKTVFVPGEQCTLTAQADAGYEFVQWEGDASGTNDKLYLTFDKNYQVYARFKAVSDIYTVTITHNGSGQVIRSSTKPHYAHNERLRLQAKADSGWIFKHWTGVSSDQKYEKEIEVTVNTHKSISAEFVKRKWTYVVYMAADNELEGSAMRAMNELESADWRGQDISVLALIDRHPGYDASDGNWSGTRLYEVRYDSEGVNNTIISERLDCAVLGLSKGTDSELDMSGVYILSGILDYAKDTYQAEQYGLIVWGHGSGWKGMGKDETSDGSVMKISRLGQAVQDKGLRIIGFDTGFAGNLEVMYELKGAGQYGIGSSGASPAEGWAYKDVFEKFLASGKDAESFCSAVIAAYKERYSGSTGAEITVCKLNKLEAVYEAYERLSKEISEAIVSREIAAKVKALLMNESLTYRDNSYPTDVYVDMKDSADKLKSQAAELSGDAGKQQRIREAADSVVQAVQAAATSGWIEGSGEAGHLGIYVVQKETAEAEGSVHDVGYIRGSGAADQCAVVKSSEWWVVQSSKNKSVLDKVFYQYR